MHTYIPLARTWIHGHSHLQGRLENGVSFQAVVYPVNNLGFHYNGRKGEHVLEDSYSTLPEDVRPIKTNEDGVLPQVHLHESPKTYLQGFLSWLCYCKIQ